MKTIISALLFLFVVQSSVFAATQVKMSTEEKKKLDTFFSNFSETNLQSFKPGELTDEMMLGFAQWHIIMNTPKDLKTTSDGNEVLVPKERIDKVTEKYFAKAVSKHEEAVYTLGLASGEAYVLSQIDTLAKLDNGLFEAKGTGYYTGSGETPDPHATPEAWKKAGIDVRIGMTFTAVIQQISQDGKPRYILLEYAVKEQE